MEVPSRDDDNDKEEYDDNTKHTYKLTTTSTMKDLVRMLIYQENNIFPLIDGERYLRPSQLDKALNSLRYRLWSFQTAEREILPHAVREIIPIGSTITNDGYVTPSGIHINKDLRSAIENVKGLYRTTQQI